MPARSRPVPAPAEAEEVPFEQAMEELEEIIRSLDGGSQELDALVIQYERGMKLLAACQQQLDTAQLRIEQITRRAGEPASSAASPCGPSSSSSPSGPVLSPVTPPPNPPFATDDDIRLF